MRIWSLLIREAWFRRTSFLAGVVGIAAAAALLVAFTAGSQAKQRVTRRVMARVGYNLRIIPATTEMPAFWRRGFSAASMPEAYVTRLAGTTGLTYNHLIPRLHGTVEVGGHALVLVGSGREVCPPGKEKPPLAFTVPRGSVVLGFDAARLLGAGKGDRIEIAGRGFQVQDRLLERGTDEDLRVFGELGDAQELLGKPGRITEIEAIDCLCLEPGGDPLGALRAQLEEVLPDTRLLQRRAIAEARARQRRTEERYFAVLLPLSLLLCAVWVLVLSLLNVNERREEIGVLRALGWSGGRVAVLVLGRAVLGGFLGGLVGFSAGMAVVATTGPGVFRDVGPSAVRFEPVVFFGVLVGAPVLAAMAAAWPTALAVVRDPARTLRGD